MKKKGFIIICSLWIIQILIIACCPASTRYYNRITNLVAHNYNVETNQNTNESIQQDNYRIRLLFLEETYTEVFNPHFIVNTAYASIDCDEIYEGLEHDIIDFSITCNKRIFDTNPGEPIAYSKFNVYAPNYIEDNENDRRTIEKWLNIMNNGGGLIYFEWYFEFNTPIDSDENLKFKIYLKQEDGTEFEVETSAVQIS